MLSGTEQPAGIAKRMRLAPDKQGGTSVKIFVQVHVWMPVRICLDGNYIFQFKDIQRNLGVQVRFAENVVPKSDDDIHGTKIDDRRGTFVKSIATVRFEEEITSKVKLRDFEFDPYLARAKSVLNQLIRAYRYVTGDHRVTPLNHSEHFICSITDEAGNVIPGGAGLETRIFPSGLQLKGTCSKAAHDAIQFYAISMGQRDMQLSKSLLVDALNHLDAEDLQHAMFDIATALEVHIDRFIETWKTDSPDPAAVDRSADKGIFSKYDEALSQITGHSLHEEPELFIALEFIRVVRNNVVHRRECVFTADALDTKKYQSRYLDEHKTKDGHLITSSEEVVKMREAAIKIVEFVNLLGKSMRSQK